MSRTPPVRVGLIGAGNIGRLHCKLMQRIPALELVCVADVDVQRAQQAAERFGGIVHSSGQALLEQGDCEAVIIATPHFDHTTLGIEALRRGYHVMVEKPISVHKADAQRLIRAWRGKAERHGQVFAAMFNQRTNPAYRRIRELIVTGALGEIRRIQWTITDWFRSQAYYDSGGWRATWAGEGGGVLLNQCPHQLDLWQWLFGMPTTVRAECDLGRHHEIEVEDEVTAVLAYENGARGVFTTSTGEAPGINRLEIAAEQGRLVYDTSRRSIEWLRTEKTVTRAIAENGGFDAPDVQRQTLRVHGTGGQHAAVLRNFAAAIRSGAPLIAPAEEGLNSVELANAMLLSAERKRPVNLPISGRAYEKMLRMRISGSRRKKGVRSAVADDMSASFR